MVIARSSPKWRQLPHLITQALNPDLGGAGAQHTQLLGGLARNINQTPACVRSAIIDAYHNRFVVAQIGDQYPRPEWQGGVGGGKGILVERFTAGGSLAVMASTVIRGYACFVIAARVYVMAGTASEQAEQGAGAE